MESEEVETGHVNYFPNKEDHTWRRRQGHGECHMAEGRGLNVFVIREEGDLKMLKTKKRRGIFKETEGVERVLDKEHRRWRWSYTWRRGTLCSRIGGKGIRQGVKAGGFDMGKDGDDEAHC